jgi:hypothetical protein
VNAAVWTLAPILGLGAMAVAVWHARQGTGRSGRHRRGVRVPADDEVEAGIA